MTTWLFRPPTVDEAPASWGDRLFVRVKLARGISILNTAGTYAARRFPTQDEISAAVAFYQGGYEYQVDDATRAALIAAGVGVTSGNFTLFGGFGSGGFGSGGFGG